MFIKSNADFLSSLVKIDSYFWWLCVKILLSRAATGVTTRTLMKRLEKNLGSNYTRVLRAIFNKSWKQDPTKQQPYRPLPSISQNIQERRARMLGKYEFISYGH